MKLQEAYTAERNQIGSWGLIGYTGPGSAATGTTDTSYTTNFGFGGELGGTTGDDASVAIDPDNGATETVGWRATSRVALNDVTAGSVWSVTVSAAGNGVLTFAAAIPDGGNALTPNFDRIGK